jgi:hypothetical protein
MLFLRRSCFSVTIMVIPVMLIESIFFPSALLVFLGQLTLQMDTLSSFLSALFTFSGCFLLRQKELPSFATLAKNAWEWLCHHPGFMSQAKSATIRMAVPAVLSCFLVLAASRSSLRLTASRSSLRLTALRSSLSMSLSFAEFSYGL